MKNFEIIPIREIERFDDEMLSLVVAGDAIPDFDNCKNNVCLTNSGKCQSNNCGENRKDCLVNTCTINL